MSNPHIYKSDDGSHVIEWIFDNLRFGIGIDPNPILSGWWLASNFNDQIQADSGDIPADVSRALWDVLEGRELK